MNKKLKNTNLNVKTSVIVPFFNSHATLGTCVNSLLHCDPPADELIFIDDGSTDDSALSLAPYPVKLLGTEHVGRAAALNIGLQHAKGNLILFTDSDCIVPRDWIGRYLKLFSRSDYGGIGGNLWPSRFSVVETAKILRYVHEFTLDHVIETNYTHFCLNGNNMAVYKEFLDGIGGFDENYHHGADADLTRRLLESGCQMLRTREISTTHLKVDTLFSFLKTSFHRGSTIRFSSDPSSPGLFLFLRACLSAGKNFGRDLISVSQLEVFGISGSLKAKGILAAGVNLLASIWNAAGRWYYAKRFRPGGVS